MIPLCDIHDWRLALSPILHDQAKVLKCENCEMFRVLLRTTNPEADDLYEGFNLRASSADAALRRIMRGEE